MKNSATLPSGICDSRLFQFAKALSRAWLTAEHSSLGLGWRGFPGGPDQTRSEGADAVAAVAVLDLAVGAARAGVGVEGSVVGPRTYFALPHLHHVNTGGAGTFLRTLACWKNAPCSHPRSAAGGGRRPGSSGQS